jgi:predicted TIM-barrel fold metal-dependent hydrolase
MQMYQQVYTDVGTIGPGASPTRRQLTSGSAEMLKNGLSKRIMFGTGQMCWPEAIGMAIDVIESTTSLPDTQRRDILYDNAARFLRLPSNSGRDD